MAKEQQQTQGKRSVQELLDSMRPDNLPSEPVGNESSPARRKTIDRRQTELNPNVTDVERRREDSDRRNTRQDEDAHSKLNEQERTLERKQERNKMRVQQHRKKKLLAGCEPVMGLNYDVLAMDDYPENALVAAAKRDRDFWLFWSMIFAGSFLVGLMDLSSAWLAGISLGLFFVSIVFAFSPLRKYFFERPSLYELLSKRKAVEFKAINHVLFLEGADGLAWRCGRMHKYNHNLARNIFDGVQRFSKERTLKSVLMSRKHIRLYLLFMIEAQKAYKRLQQDYLKNHFEHMDQGWDDAITDAEEAELSKELGIEQDAGVDLI